MSYTAEDILDELASPEESLGDFSSALPQTAADFEQLLLDPERASKLERALSGPPQNTFFPSLDLNISLACVRLTAWRDRKHWALAIEVLCFNVRAGGNSGIQDQVHLFGNGIRPNQTEDGSNIVRIHAVEDAPGSQTFLRNGLELCPTTRNILVRGKPVAVDLSPAALKATGLTEPAINGVKPWAGAVFLRSLLSEHREKLLATEDELSAMVLPGLPFFMRLEEWHHPNTGEGESPRDSETFQLLAEAIAAGDPTKYRPTLKANTDWRNWPEFCV